MKLSYREQIESYRWKSGSKGLICPDWLPAACTLYELDNCSRAAFMRLWTAVHENGWVSFNHQFHAKLLGRKQFSSLRALLADLTLDSIQRGEGIWFDVRYKPTDSSGLLGQVSGKSRWVEKYCQDHAKFAVRAELLRHVTDKGRLAALSRLVSCSPGARVVVVPRWFVSRLRSCLSLSSLVSSCCSTIECSLKRLSFDRVSDREVLVCALESAKKECPKQLTEDGKDWWIRSTAEQKAKSYRQSISEVERAIESGNVGSISECNGRFQHMITNLPKCFRGRLRLAGKPLAGADIHAAHVQFSVALFAESSERERLVELLQSGDFYGRAAEMAGLDKGDFKKAFQADFHYSHRPGTRHINVMMRECFPAFSRDVSAIRDSGIEVRKTTKRINRYKIGDDGHPKRMKKSTVTHGGQIRLSITLNRVEGLIIMTTMKRLREKHPQIPLVPIHDCLYSSCDYADIVKNELQEVSAEILGFDVVCKTEFHGTCRGYHDYPLPKEHPGKHSHPMDGQHLHSVDRLRESPHRLPEVLCGRNA